MKQTEQEQAHQFSTSRYTEQIVGDFVDEAGSFNLRIWPVVYSRLSYEHNIHIENYTNIGYVTMKQKCIKTYVVHQPKLATFPKTLIIEPSSIPIFESLHSSRYPFILFCLLLCGTGGTALFLSALVHSIRAQQHRLVKIDTLTKRDLFVNTAKLGVQ